MLREKRAPEHGLKFRDEGAIGNGIAHSFFGKNDAAFALDFFFRQEQPARVIAEHAETFRERGRIGVGQFEKINGAIETGVGVGVAAKAHSHALEKFHQRPGRVMRAAVEGHVLEEVGEAALILLFFERTAAHEQTEGGASFRFVIGQHNIAEAVWQGSEMRRGIGFKIARFLRERRSFFEWRRVLRRSDWREGESEEEKKAEKKLRNHEAEPWRWFDNGRRGMFMMRASARLRAGEPLTPRRLCHTVGGTRFGRWADLAFSPRKLPMFNAARRRLRPAAESRPF